MTIVDSCLEIDRGKVREAQAHSDFSDNAWLTFYLAGQSTDLEALNAELRELDTKNLDGSEGGFVYAKVPVQLIEKAIIKQVEQVRKQAESHKIAIHIVDLDPTDEMHSKKFYTLWKASL